jgi:hypothetical protein
MTDRPRPGQWVVVSYGPGEIAVAACVQDGGKHIVRLDRSPFVVDPIHIKLCLHDREAAAAFAEGVNRANARHTAAMERARHAAAAQWTADVEGLR